MPDLPNYLQHITKLAVTSQVGSLHYSNYGCAISEGAVGVFADIRGYGHLSKGRTEDAAASIQDARGQLVVAVVPVAGELAKVAMAASAFLDCTEPRQLNDRLAEVSAALHALHTALVQRGANPQIPEDVRNILPPTWERDHRGNV